MCGGVSLSGGGERVLKRGVNETRLLDPLTSRLRRELLDGLGSLCIGINYEHKLMVQDPCRSGRIFNQSFHII